MKELDERWFNEYRRNSLAGKRKMNGDQHRDWDLAFRAMGRFDDSSVCTVVMTNHVRLRVDPTSQSEAVARVLINTESVPVLGFARGERLYYNDIWLLDAETKFYFWAGEVRGMPRYLPEYDSRPRTFTMQSTYPATGEELVKVWSDPVILHRESDILGEK